MSRLPVILLLLLTATLSGQVSLTEDYFPVVGDTLKYNVAGPGLSLDLLSAGPGMQWDFGDITAERELDLAAASAVGDTVFTTADLALDIDTSTAGYYRTTDGALELVGIRGTNPLLPGYEIEAALSPARAERRAPLTYQDAFSTTATNVVTVATTDLPEDAREDFGTLLAGVDSIRLTSVSERDDSADAYGTLSLNGRTYDVLREKRVEVITTKVELRTGGLGYNDVTPLLQTFAPEFAPFLGEQAPVTTYYFWSPGQKEAIATVTEEEDGSISRMTYARGDATNSTGGPFLRQAIISVYPNPAHDLTTFDVSGLEAGEYTISVFNVLGRRVAGTRFAPAAGVARVPVELGNLPRGTYLYSLINERGRILTTRRVMVGG